MEEKDSLHPTTTLQLSRILLLLPTALATSGSLEDTDEMDLIQPAHSMTYGNMTSKPDYGPGSMGIPPSTTREYTEQKARPPLQTYPEDVEML